MGDDQKPTEAVQVQAGPGLPVRVLRFARGLGERFLRDHCLEHAAALSFTTVTSLIPVGAISLAVLSAVPSASEFRVGIEEFITRYLLPHAGEVAVSAFRDILSRAAHLTGWSFVGLVATALMMLATVNGAFDRIWRVNRQRPLLIRLLAYSIILVLGPLLIGGALSLSGLLLSTGMRYGGAIVERSVGWVTPPLPFVLECIAFTLLYRIVPNRTVAWRDAICGGALAAGLFEGAKHGVAAYILHFPTYDAIYGALSAIPVFLIWIYWSWVAILMGAETAALLPEWRTRSDGAAAA